VVIDDYKCNGVFVDEPMVVVVVVVVDHHGGLVDRHGGLVGSSCGNPQTNT
jgi:hypothetical protein